MDVDIQPPAAQDLSGISPIIALLHEGDRLAGLFQKQYNESLSAVQALLSAHLQRDNLLRLASRPGGGGGGGGGGGAVTTATLSEARRRTVARLEEAAEECYACIRGCLARMEEAVDGLAQLLFRVDVYLAQPATALQHGLNPAQALSHLSGLHGSRQAELIAKREAFADLGAGEVSVEDFARGWKALEEIRDQDGRTMDDLADVMGRWGA